MTSAFRTASAGVAVTAPAGSMRWRRVQFQARTGEADPQHAAGHPAPAMPVPQQRDG